METQTILRLKKYFVAGKRSFLLLLLMFPLCGAGTLFADAPERHDMRRGNKLYKKSEFDKAEIAYRHGFDKDSTAFGSRFNLAGSLYKQDKTEEAEKLFQSLVEADESKAQKARLFHNLGNSQLQQKKYDESIKAYKQSLRLNPADDETRANLAYAQAMLQKQQQEQQQNQDNQDQNKDQNKDQQNQDNQQNKDQNKDQKDKQDQNKDNQQDQQNQQNKQDQQEQQDKQDKQNEQQQPTISPQDAQRMLEAVQADEKNTQDKVSKEKAKALKRQRIEKNW
jgi:tetratricopeptide (TPR) repeat protein